MLAQKMNHSEYSPPPLVVDPEGKGEISLSKIEKMLLVTKFLDLKSFEFLLLNGSPDQPQSRVANFSFFLRSISIDLIDP